MGEIISDDKHFRSTITWLGDDDASYDDEVIDENDDVVIVVGVCVFCKRISYVRWCGQKGR